MQFRFAVDFCFAVLGIVRGGIITSQLKKTMAMKHRIGVGLLILILCLGAMSGCKRTMHSVIENEPRFIGIVESSTDEYALVKLNEDDPLYDNHATIQVSLDVELKDSFLSFGPGDEIVVYYDGNITDGKAETVYAITLQTPSSQEK